MVVPMVTNIYFLLAISIHCQEIRLIRESALIFYQIFSTHSLWKCIETSLENLYVDIGAKRVDIVCRKFHSRHFILLSCLGAVIQDDLQDDSYGNSIEFV